MTASKDDQYFRYRLSFRFSQKGVINVAEGDDENADELTYDQPNGFPVTLRATGKTFSDSYQFQLSRGGFRSASAAWDEAKELLGGLALLATELGVGVDAGPFAPGDYSPAKAAPGTVSWSPGLFEKVETENNCQTVAQKLGITIVRQRNKTENVSSVGFGGMLAQQPLKPLGFLQLLVRMSEQQPKFDARASLALELYSMSFFENSLRASFLTLVQMLESLAPETERSDEVKKFVDHIALLTKQAGSAAKKQKNFVDSAAYDGIQGALSWLKTESITQSIKRLVENCLGTSPIDGLAPSKFIRKCYDVRSSLTHSGQTDLTTNEFVALVHSLRTVCLGVLRHTLQYAPLIVPEDAIALPSLHGAIEFT